MLTFLWYDILVKKGSLQSIGMAAIPKIIDLNTSLQSKLHDLRVLCRLLFLHTGLNEQLDMKSSLSNPQTVEFVNFLQQNFS